MKNNSTMKAILITVLGLGASGAAYAENAAAPALPAGITVDDGLPALAAEAPATAAPPALPAELNVQYTSMPPVGSSASATSGSRAPVPKPAPAAAPASATAQAVPLESACVDQDAKQKIEVALTAAHDTNVQSIHNIVYVSDPCKRGSTATSCLADSMPASDGPKARYQKSLKIVRNSPALVIYAGEVAPDRNGNGYKGPIVAKLEDMMKTNNPRARGAYKKFDGAMEPGYSIVLFKDESSRDKFMETYHLQLADLTHLTPCVGPKPKPQPAPEAKGEGRAAPRKKESALVELEVGMGAANIGIEQSAYGLTDHTDSTSLGVHARAAGRIPFASGNARVDLEGAVDHALIDADITDQTGANVGNVQGSHTEFNLNGSGMYTPSRYFEIGAGPTFQLRMTQYSGLRDGTDESLDPRIVEAAKLDSSETQLRYGGVLRMGGAATPENKYVELQWSAYVGGQGTERQDSEMSGGGVKAGGKLHLVFAKKGSYEFALIGSYQNVHDWLENPKNMEEVLSEHNFAGRLEYRGGNNSSRAIPVFYLEYSGLRSDADSTFQDRDVRSEGFDINSFGLGARWPIGGNQRE